MQDIHFDNVAKTFNAAIYGTSKGYIRLGVLWEDLCQTVPEIKTKKLRVLDVGGGMGQISLRLAELGHSIVLADPSQDMLHKAEETLTTKNLTNISLICSTAQNLSAHLQTTFDLVLCHAVLEWVAYPEEIIKALSQFIGEEGILSLMFFNQNSSILKSAIRGDFDTFSSIPKAQAAEQALPERPSEGELAGARGLQSGSVEAYLGKYQLAVHSKAGIRIFHDYIPDEHKQHQLAKLLQLEISYKNVEPFASLGQHIHLVCRRVNT